MNAQGKNILITGGAVRIGKALSEAFADSGSKVTVHYNNSETEAEELLDRLGGEKAGHRIIKADLADDSQLKTLVESIDDIDILINNASVFDNKKLEHESLELAKRQFDINFWAPFALMKELVSAKKTGVIINILDYRIAKLDNGDGIYALSKKCLADLTLSAALQWAPDVRVNGIALGYVMPPVGLENSRMKKSMLKIPMRKPVPVNEIIDTCRFIINNDSITGEILYLDGGAHL